MSPGGCGPTTQERLGHRREPGRAVAERAWMAVNDTPGAVSRSRPSSRPVRVRSGRSTPALVAAASVSIAPWPTSVGVEDARTGGGDGSTDDVHGGGGAVELDRRAGPMRGRADAHGLGSQRQVVVSPGGMAGQDPGPTLPFSTSIVPAGTSWPRDGARGRCRRPPPVGEGSRTRRSVAVDGEASKPNRIEAVQVQP